MSKRGFTLIELLVVVSIIGMMSSIVLSSVNSARDRAYNTSRTQEALAIQKAVLALSSEYGYVPVPTTGPGVYNNPGGDLSLQMCLTNKKQPSGSCGFNESEFFENNAFKNILKDYYIFSGGENLTVGPGGESYVGPVFVCHHASLEGQCPLNEVDITWVIKSNDPVNANCILPKSIPVDIISEATAAFCFMSF